MIKQSTQQSLMKISGLFLGISFSGFVYSAEKVEKLTPAESLLPMLIGLVVILAVIFGLAFLFKKFSNFGLSGKNIQLLETQMIGNKEKLIIVQVQQQRFLIGVTNHSISQLGELNDFNDEETIEAGLASRQKPVSQSNTSFSNVISKLLKGTLITELHATSNNSNLNKMPKNEQQKASESLV